MTSCVDNFPEGYTPSGKQVNILNKIDAAWENNVKYVVVNAPTGIGKSFIAKAVANSVPTPDENWQDFVRSGQIYECEEEDVTMSLRQGTAVLTMTKALQNQYSEFFPDDGILKGKANYQCVVDGKVTCDIGPCVVEPHQKEICLSCEACPYFEARNDAVAGQCSYYSYAMFLSLPPACRAKRVLICDEASEIEDVLVQNYTVNFNFKQLIKLDIDLPVTPTKGASYTHYIEWVRTSNMRINEAYTSLLRQRLSKKAAVTKGKNKSNELIKLKILAQYSEATSKLLDMMVETEFVIEHTREALIFKPLKIDKIAQKLFKLSDFVILMSATIIDHKNFTKQLGISEDEYEYIEENSSFDPKKAPIMLSTKVGVSFSNKEKTIPMLCYVADQICKKHSNEKGIIHTHTMNITEMVRAQLGNSQRYLYRGVDATNEDIINEHIDSPLPTVLVSPSMTHGIDLKGDLGKFSIIIKAPYLPLGDERVKRLFNEDPEWYINKMLSNFIQQCGRTIRSKQDEATTYVLDAVLSNTILENKHKLPKYFVDRLQ